MLSSKDIKEKAIKWWNDGSFLQSHLRGIEFSAKDISKIGLDDVSKIHESVSEVLKSQKDLIQNSKQEKGFGYNIEWQEKNYKNIGKNRFIKRIFIETELDFLKLIGKEKEFKLFKENVDLIKQSIPELTGWIVENPIDVVNNNGKWADLVKVCHYFKTEHAANKFYIRELPISVHTKFIENNKGLISSLLDYLIPHKIVASKNFFIRYSIKDKEKLIRIRILCDKVKETFNYTDFSIRLSDFVGAEIKAKNVFITENELNFLTLPKKENSIAIWSGGGFQISFLANIDWLRQRQIYYWGDLDAAGLAILSQLRTYYPNSVSLLMDRDTFGKHYEGGKSDKKIPANDLKGLTDEETELFYYLKKDNLRLEQEKIPQDIIMDIMNNLK